MGLIEHRRIIAVDDSGANLLGLLEEGSLADHFDKSDEKDVRHMLDAKDSNKRRRHNLRYARDGRVPGTRFIVAKCAQYGLLLACNTEMSYDQCTLTIR